LGLTDFAGNALVGNDPATGDYVVHFTVAGPAVRDPSQWTAVEPNDPWTRPQDLGVLVPNDLPAGVTITRDFPAHPQLAPADPADYSRFQVLQSRQYAFALGGADLSVNGRPVLVDGNGNPIDPGGDGPDNTLIVDLTPGTYEIRVGGWSADQAAGAVYQLQ